MAEGRAGPCSPGTPWVPTRTSSLRQLGWPGISLGLLHGATPRLDLGGKFTFNYGQEGMVEIVEPGIKLQAWVRLMLARTPQATLALVFQPGPLF